MSKRVAGDPEQAAKRQKALRVCIIGCGSLGACIAKGLLSQKLVEPQNLILTRRTLESLQNFKEQGVHLSTNNDEAIKASDVIIFSLLPNAMRPVLQSVAAAIDSSKTVISVATGVPTAVIKESLGWSQTRRFKVVRAMPNTAIAVAHSMTCLCVNKDDLASMPDEIQEGLQTAKDIFESVGIVTVLKEDLMIAATALCACGLAFFSRAIRAASQGGVEIGFHAPEAIRMAAATALGASALLLEQGGHPEAEVDKVTTPMGCTIAGLNKMEHKGFSSAFIQGIVTAANKADQLFTQPKQ